MTGFAVAAIEPLTLDRGPKIERMFVLSPFVWREPGGYSMLLRVVPDEPDPTDKIARIHYGHSQDGLRFEIDDDPVIAPGPGAEDLDGCEDPTVVRHAHGCHVFYSGWNEQRKEDTLTLASGPDLRTLSKHRPVLRSGAGHRNPKEATVVRTPAGDWRMFFEFASHGASEIGCATAEVPEGPWEVLRPLCTARPNEWDDWHTSPGPIWQPNDGPPIMFYNGANLSAHWRISWLALDASYTSVVERAAEPLIIPPVPAGDATDIAFAASCIEENGGIRLYYSIADRAMLRATLRRV